MKPNQWCVLVVEDEYDSIQMVSKILRHHGVDVHIANNGHECLAKLEVIEPTLVIMDLALPEMDGWEFLNKYEKLPEQKKAEQVYLLTTSSNLNDINHANKHVCNPGYLIKPIDEHTLNTILG